MLIHLIEMFSLFFLHFHKSKSLDTTDKQFAILPNVSQPTGCELSFILRRERNLVHLLRECFVAQNDRFTSPVPHSQHKVRSRAHRSDFISADDSSGVRDAPYWWEIQVCVRLLSAASQYSVELQRWPLINVDRRLVAFLGNCKIFQRWVNLNTETFLVLNFWKWHKEHGSDALDINLCHIDLQKKEKKRKQIKNAFIFIERLYWEKTLVITKQKTDIRRNPNKLTAIAPIPRPVVLLINCCWCVRRLKISRTFPAAKMTVSFPRDCRFDRFWHSKPNE